MVEKRKNINELREKPLISYTINAGKKSKYIYIIVVSKENSEIKQIPEKFGVEVKDRLKYLSMDDSSTIRMVVH